MPTSFSTLNFSAGEQPRPGADPAASRPFEMQSLFATVGAPDNVEASIQSLSPDHLTKDLSVAKLNDIHRHLWWAGRPGNIRPLHRQKMMLRDILITECPELHLVWHDSTIYIKPFPEYLLHPEFFNKHIQPDEELYRTACGFIYSYSKLIEHKSDFNIAKETDLLPSNVDWAAWCQFASNTCNILPANVNKRYRYGELRLRRLNHIYMFCRRKMAYHSVYTQYDHYFTQHFAWLLLLFAYLTIILTAMQVVLATPSATASFEVICYWFGVLSIIVTIVGVATIAALFLALFLYNMVSTLCYKRKYRQATKGGY